MIQRDNKKEESFNKALGLRLMVRRQNLQITQNTLGAYLGVTGQQVQKYENGKNRISPEKLKKCAEFLEIPVGYFYGEVEEPYWQINQKNVVVGDSDIKILPYDIRQHISHLIKLINKLSQNRSNDNTST